MAKNRRKKSSFKTTFKKFRIAVEKKLGKIPWERLSKHALTLIIVLATLGVFGPIAQSVAEVFT